MNCNEFKDLLDALIDSEIDPADREAAGDHVLSCPECARLRDVTLRVKRIVGEKADRPVASAALRSRLEERLGDQAENDKRGSGSAETHTPGKVLYFSASRLAAAAAILIFATLAFFFLPGETTPKLRHYVAAEQVRDAFLRSYDTAETQSLQPKDDRELRQVVEDEIGVKLKEIKVPGSDYLGWHRQSLAGHRAIRLDFRPRAGGTDKADAPESAAIISVFLLPMKDTEFSESYLEELQSGHYCQACVKYQGTIFCVRKDDVFVAAVTNVEGQSLAKVVDVK